MNPLASGRLPNGSLRQRPRTCLGPEPSSSDPAPCKLGPGVALHGMANPRAEGPARHGGGRCLRFPEERPPPLDPWNLSPSKSGDVLPVIGVSEESIFPSAQG